MDTMFSENKHLGGRKRAGRGLVGVHPLQFGLFIQVGCPVDQIEGSEEQGEGYSGNPVNLAHTVEGLLGLGGFRFGLLLGLAGGRRGAFGNGGQTRVSGNVWGKGCGRGGWVRSGVVLLQERFLLFLLLLWHHTFSIPGVAPLGEVVDSGELDEGREDKGIANSNEPVHSRGVGHLWKGVPSADTESGHGQHGCHSKHSPGRDGLSVEPERHL